MRICINPIYNPSDHTEGGIRRVVDAMVKYLPEFGMSTTSNPNSADLIVNHGTYNDQRPGVPTIAACHGLYWAGYNWDAWADDANRAVTDNMIAADAITVPSKWVANAVSRGLWRPAHTIYHGVDADQWEPGTSKQYVLWNKARTDPVSNHADVDKIAEQMTGTSFVSTFGKPQLNTRIIGPQSYETMKLLVKHAGVYLQTARETGAIGVMEAMASGVPVAGWRFGAQEEIIVDGETGYLAEYGNYEELADCIERCLNERNRLGANARQDVLERWGWQDKIEQYAALFTDVVQNNYDRTHKTRISVVITCYNLGAFLNDAIDSVMWQEIDNPELECIVVDDCSTDNSLEIAKQLKDYYPSRGEGTDCIKVVRTPTNLGLSGARNFGASQAKGKYLIFLDADDKFAVGALRTMMDFLDTHPYTDIAYGMLDTIAENGGQQSRNPWPTGRFDYTAQMAHLNQLSYSSMMRYRTWKNLGGYRTRDWRAEDASFWCRASSFGYHIDAATDNSTLIYRIRSNSKSGQERNDHSDADGDWTAWFPWRAGASTGQQGADLMGQTPKPVLPLSQVPFGAQTPAPKRKSSWAVRHHQEPAVSIIIPVGPKHSPWLVDALDSVMAQTVASWECIVVYDNSEPLPTTVWPWVRFIYSSEGIIPPYDPKGAGASRNAGLRAARAPLTLFLDADDILRPEALERLLNEYAVKGGYVYSDTLATVSNVQIADLATKDWRNLPSMELRGSVVEQAAVMPAAEWDQKLFLTSGYDGRPGCHSVTALVATVDALGVGGFDEKMKALEDWEFYMRLAASGITGHLVPEPLLIYRLFTGARREDRKGAQSDLETIIRTRYAPFITGEKEMCSCGSGGGGANAQARAAAAIAELLAPENSTFVDSIPDLRQLIESGQDVRLKYIGDSYGAITYKGNVTRRSYRAGQEPAAQFVDVDPRDLESLLLSSVFQVVHHA